MFSPETHSAADMITLFNLEPIPQEGGFFRRTGEAAMFVREETIAGAASRPVRRAWSAIYALFTPDGFSAMHKLASDELWFFHAGDPLESLRIHPDGRGGWVRLGFDVAKGERPQDVIAAGLWQGTQLARGGRWAFVSTVVAPEFVWSDFELADRGKLSAAHPEFCEGIRALTR